VILYDYLLQVGSAGESISLIVGSDVVNCNAFLDIWNGSIQLVGFTGNRYHENVPRLRLLIANPPEAKLLALGKEPDAPVKYLSRSRDCMVDLDCLVFGQGPH